MYRRFLIENSRKILVFSICIQIVCMIVFGYTYQKQQDEAKKNIVQFTEQYVEKVTNELKRNDSYMGVTTVDSKDYRGMFGLDELSKIGKISELQVTYKLLSSASDYRYHFFSMNREDDDFIELTAVKLPFERYRRIRPYLKDGASEKIINGKWIYIKTEQENIIASFWLYDQFVLGAWITEEDFLKDVSQLDYGSGGGISLVLKEDMDKTGLSMKNHRATIYELEDVNSDFEICEVLKQNSEMKRIMILQVLQFALGLQVLIVLLVMMWQLRKNFIIPVKNLVEVLDRYRSVKEYRKQKKENEAPDVVNDAYQILDRLGNHVESLSLQLCKSEMEKKQLEINFRNLQIRPHFFVNCLAMISGMAQIGDVEKIQKMTVCISEYYRYICQDCLDMIPLSAEIHHMENLIKIRGEWNANEIQFRYELETGTDKTRIPVLSVSTFLENSIKHAMTGAGILKIRLTAKKAERNMVSICITDNGAGFSEEVCEQLNQGAPVADTGGKHIGINNVKQRISLIYGEKARILFRNTQEGGACVDILIPEETETL